VVFKAKEKHPANYKTYFGYWKDDGFIKRKSGREDYKEKWNEIKSHWLENYRNKEEIDGFSIKKCVTANDEWCVEAYIITDYSKLNETDFIQALKEYSIFQYLKEEKGNTPIISSKGTNNGIYGWFNIKPRYKHVISVPNTGTVCYAYYQGYDCCIDDNCLVMIPKKELSMKEMICISLLIRKDKIRYFYGRQVTPERLGNTKINFNFSMFNHVKVQEFKKKSLTNNKIKLDTKNWKSFRIIDLFEIKKGERLVQEERIEGNVPFITATSENNGVVDHISYEKFKGIKLPADKNGNPDWQFMENYVKSFPYSSNL